MRLLKIAKYIALFAGLLLLGGAYLSYNNTQQFYADAKSTTGTVTDLLRSGSGDDIMYRPKFRFTTDTGTIVHFTAKLATNPASYDIGESVNILYPKDNPEDARVNTFFSLWLSTMVMGILGAILLLISLVPTIIHHRQKRRQAKLLLNGRVIMADYEAVIINDSLQVNGRYPYKIKAKWTDPASQQTHYFNSVNLWQDPTPYLSDTLSVYIEPNNPHKYYMDVSFLPEKHA